MTYNRPGRKRYRTPPERQARPEIHNIDMFIVPPPEPTIYMSIFRNGTRYGPKTTPEGTCKREMPAQTPKSEVEDKTKNKLSLLDKL